MLVRAKVLFVFSKSTKPSLRNALNVPNPEVIKQVELLWIQGTQRGLKAQIKKLYYKRLNLEEQEDGIIVVRGCAKK